MVPNTRLPRLAVLLGIAGLIPFLGAGLGSVSANEVQAARLMAALLAYGAVILSFLGGVHWGLALAPADPASLPSVSRARIVLGVIPSLLGWVALLLAVAMPPEAALAVLIVGFTGTLLVEARAGRRGLVPRGYMWLRWAISIVVVVVLVTVLGLRLLGAHVLLNGGM